MHKETNMKTYEVTAGQIHLDRRYFRGEEVRLTDDQARYLIMNGKIALKGEEQTQE